MKSFVITLLALTLMSLSGYSQGVPPPLIVYDSVLHRVSKVIVGVDTFGTFSMAEVRALNTLGSITDECNETSDSLLSYINNAVEALEASRKVGKELRVLYNNCDSISHLKDLQINLRLKQYKSEQIISEYYKSRSSTWITIGMLSLGVNVAMLLLYVSK